MDTIFYKPGEFAKAVGVSVKTLQRWDREGLLKAHRNVKGRRCYTEDQLMAIVGSRQKEAAKQFVKSTMITRGQLYLIFRDELSKAVNIATEAPFCAQVIGLYGSLAALPARWPNTVVMDQAFVTEHDLIEKRDVYEALFDLTASEPLAQGPGWEDRLAARDRIIEAIGCTELEAIQH